LTVHIINNYFNYYLSPLYPIGNLEGVRGLGLVLFIRGVHNVSV